MTRRLSAFGASGAASALLVSRFRLDSRLQDELTHPPGALLVWLLAACVIGSVFGLMKSPARGALVTAVILTSVTDFAILYLALYHRWLGGTAFRLPFEWLVLVYAPAVAWFLTAPLALYAYLVQASKRWAMFAYAASVMGFAWLSCVVVPGLLEDGTFLFAGGYSTAWDAAWGVAQYALLLWIYRLRAPRRAPA